MNEQLFEQLEQTLDKQGPAAAIDRLCAELRERKDYANLFYALLMKKRHELGVSPVPTGSAQELPAAVHSSYEDAIRDACRTVGRMYLAEDNIPSAWAYFRMLGETEPVAQAVEKFQVVDGEDSGPVIDIAFHQGVHPRRGFDLLLKNYGICSAITTLGSMQFPPGSDTREYCVRKLIRALHDELRERLAADVERQEGKRPESNSIAVLIEGRDYLFGDDYYHIDVSHLSSVVQMAIQLSGGEELQLARELCAYGRRLSPKFQYPGDPPFEDQYRDYGVFLSILAGEDVEGGLAHFRTKAEQADPETVGIYPAEVLVNLLLRLGRQDDALATARRFLASADERRLSCPPISELCERTKNFRTLAEVAREQNNPVHFVAGLIGAGQKR